MVTIATTLLVILSYLFYLPFDTWAFLAFLAACDSFCSRWLPDVSSTH